MDMANVLVAVPDDTMSRLLTPGLPLMILSVRPMHQMEMIAPKFYIQIA